jgi:hypothetical protein
MECGPKTIRRRTRVLDAADVFVADRDMRVAIGRRSRASSNLLRYCAGTDDVNRRDRATRRAGGGSFAKWLAYQLGRIGRIGPGA